MSQRVWKCVLPLIRLVCTAIHYYSSKKNDKPKAEVILIDSLNRYISFQ